MNTLIVRLWGEEIGRLGWSPTDRLVTFYFNPALKERPDIAPILCPVDRWNPRLPYVGSEDRLYQGLPPFIADSLPDSWGNALFERWVKKHRIPSWKVSPLFKLAFIGKRGMGALEFEPAAEELSHHDKIDINELYRLSLTIYSQRENYRVETENNLSFESLISAGTSAGGRQMKAIVAINHSTGEVRSGQIAGLSGFEYHIIKFGDTTYPSAEIEMCYYEMASSCGIQMKECRLVNIEGINHFLTKRFDRRDGEKIHLQTLAAINPEVNSYEGLIDTAIRLRLSDSELRELYRRMVFNVLSGNTDDHTKNFSFMLDRHGGWKLSPAYDLTFIFNRYGTGHESGQSLSINGKHKAISLKDLLNLGRENGIRNPESIIKEIGEALSKFPELALKYHIPTRWSNIIQETLHKNLVNFGLKKSPADSIVVENIEVTNIVIKRNSKGVFDIKANIGEQPVRKFIRQNNPEFKMIESYQAGMLDNEEVVKMFKAIFWENNAEIH